ncbi:hypothetical protein T439DRAFT_123529 [Meredithblackwellia eburnea MCA 4105]
MAENGQGAPQAQAQAQAHVRASPVPGKAGRLARSRAACLSCHAVKQRCDGPSVQPCHRCVTYGIECVFPSSAGPAASKSNLASGRSPTNSKQRSPSVSSQNSPQQQQQVIQPAQQQHQLPVPQAATTTLVPSPELAETLRLMMARLESIESTLARATTANQHSSSLSTHSESPRPSSTNHYNNAQASYKPSKNNPVETAGEAMAVEGLVDLSGPRRNAAISPDSQHLVTDQTGSIPANGQTPTSAGAVGVGSGGPDQTPGATVGQQPSDGIVDSWGSTLTRPDVIDKGLMTVAECEQEVELYFRQVHPWMVTLSIATDTSLAGLRARPLLFHSLILLSLYYRPRTRENMFLYREVVSIVENLLGPIILCAQTDQLNSDLIRSLYLLLMYKPLQVNALGTRGIVDPAAVEQLSKMNTRASWMIRTMCGAISNRIGLPSITVTFARAFANQHNVPIPDDIINDQRLYFAYIWHSMHGGLQSGASVDPIPSDALKTTRLFATLRKEPSDVRLAASVELAAIASALLTTRLEGDKVEAEDLARFDQEMDTWNDYWVPILNTQADDQLFYTTQYPYAAFVRVVVNGYSFSRWKTERKDAWQRAQSAAAASAAAGSANGRSPLSPPPPPPPTLSILDRESIARVVNATEGMILALTVEGRAELFSRGRSMAWSGVGSTLTLDKTVIERLRWSSDSLTCVVYSYSLILLAKLANEGLLRPDLQLIPALSPPLPIPLPPLDPTDKLSRLLEIGAQALDELAPNPHHPAKKQASFLRRIREAALGGRRSMFTSAPGSPKPHQPQLASLAFPAAAATPLPSTTQLPSAALFGPSNNGAGMSMQQDHHSNPLGGVYPFAPSINPTPVHSPLPEDPFAALLGGVNTTTNVFDGQAFFGLDVGSLNFDWDGLDHGLATYNDLNF